MRKETEVKLLNDVAIKQTKTKESKLDLFFIELGLARRF